MAFPTLLTFYAHANDTAALTAGLALAAQYGAQLDVLHVLRDATKETQLLALSVSAQHLEDLAEQETESRIAEASMLFRDFIRLAEEHHVTTLSGGAQADAPCIDLPVARWLLAEDEPEAAFIMQSHLHDLTIIAWHKEHREIDLESVLMASARPLMMIPENWRSRRFTRASILWNHSAGATHAVALSLPILKTMEKVQILTASHEPPAAIKGMSLERYLASHGITTETLTIHASGNPSTELYAACTDYGSDMIVMGAFSRKTLREKLRGGVTRALLDKSSIPLLMAY